MPLFQQGNPLFNISFYKKIGTLCYLYTINQKKYSTCVTTNVSYTTLNYTVWMWQI